MDRLYSEPKLFVASKQRPAVVVESYDFARKQYPKKCVALSNFFKEISTLWPCKGADGVNNSALGTPQLKVLCEVNGFNLNKVEKMIKSGL
jgi:hypothetical protein